MSRDHNTAPVDYLIIGHLTIDHTPQGPQLGGTAAFSGLTARAMGLRVGILTSWGEELELGPLGSISIRNIYSPASTTFENVATPSGRKQRILAVATTIEHHMIPKAWLSASIIHLGPVAQEVAPELIQRFPQALIGVTPQGWMRDWNTDGKVGVAAWPDASSVLKHASATVVSMEDVAGDEARLEEMASYCPVLAVTEGSQGVRLYWKGDVRRFKPPPVKEVDATGAGDIFAAAFFARLHDTRDPWEAARFSTLLAANSVTRAGLSALPTREEITACQVQVL